MIKQLFNPPKSINENAFSKVTGVIKAGIETYDIMSNPSQRFYQSGTTSKNGVSFDWVVTDVIDKLSDIRDKYTRSTNREAVLSVELFLRELAKKKSIKEINLGVDNVDSDANMELFVWVKARNGGWMIIIDSEEIKVFRRNSSVTTTGSVKVDSDFGSNTFGTAKNATHLHKLFGGGDDSFVIPLKPASQIYDKLEAIIK